MEKHLDSCSSLLSIRSALDLEAKTSATCMNKRPQPTIQLRSCNTSCYFRLALEKAMVLTSWHAWHWHMRETSPLQRKTKTGTSDSLHKPLGAFGPGKGPERPWSRGCHRFAKRKRHRVVQGWAPPIFRSIPTQSRGALDFPKAKVEQATGVHGSARHLWRFPLRELARNPGHSPRVPLVSLKQPQKNGTPPKKIERSSPREAPQHDPMPSRHPNRILGHEMGKHKPMQNKAMAVSLNDLASGSTRTRNPTAFAHVAVAQKTGIPKWRKPDR